MPGEDVLDIHAAFRRLNDEFKGVPGRTVIPVPELNWCRIFGNLEPGAILSEVAVDKAGRFWRHDREKGALVMFFDPNPINVLVHSAA